MNRIIVCGTRTFTDYTRLCEELDKIIPAYEHNEIVSGRAKGADTLGEQYAYEHAIPVALFPARWNIYGKSAGYRRNAEMLEYAKQATPIVIAFWDGKSRGTKHMIETARKANATVHVIQYQ